MILGENFFQNGGIEGCEVVYVGFCGKEAGG